MINTSLNVSQYNYIRAKTICEQYLYIILKKYKKKAPEGAFQISFLKNKWEDTYPDCHHKGTSEYLALYTEEPGLVDIQILQTEVPHGYHL